MIQKRVVKAGGLPGYYTNTKPGSVDILTEMITVLCRSVDWDSPTEAIKLELTGGEGITFTARNEDIRLKTELLEEIDPNSWKLPGKESDKRN